MEIKTRPLNKGEIFPCSFKSAKSVFKDTAVTLNFGYTSRIYGTFARTPDAFYLKNKIGGSVIAAMSMYPRQENPLLCFYVLKKESFPSQLQKEFESKYLFRFYDFYQKLLKDNTLNDKEMLMLVELLGGTLKLHLVKY